MLALRTAALTIVFSTCLIVAMLGISAGGTGFVTGALAAFGNEAPIVGSEAAGDPMSVASADAAGLTLLI